MATLILTCKCGQQMKVPESALGKTGTCVGCGKRLKVTKRNTAPCEQETQATPPEPVEGEPRLTDVQKVTQALTSRGVETPPGWQEFENMYAASEKAASRRSARRKAFSWFTIVSLAIVCLIAFATRTGKEQPLELRPTQVAPSAQQAEATLPPMTRVPVAQVTERQETLGQVATSQVRIEPQPTGSYRQYSGVQQPALQVDFSGECVGVSDGDTISMMHNGRPEKIRLHGIDCPESHQAFGSRAKQFTSSLVFGKVVSVDVKDKDRYGRTVGVVYLPDGRSVNAELVAAGLAWWYREYAPNDTTLAQLESQARAARVELWSDPHAIAPWDFRRGGGTPQRQVVQQPFAPQARVERPADVVYVTDTGNKYHGDGCRYLSKSKIPVSLEEAKARGYTPCSACGPH